MGEGCLAKVSQELEHRSRQRPHTPLRALTPAVGICPLSEAKLCRGSGDRQGGAFQSLPALPCSGAQESPLLHGIGLMVKQVPGEGPGGLTAEPSGVQDSEMVYEQVLLKILCNHDSCYKIKGP